MTYRRTIGRSLLLALGALLFPAWPSVRAAESEGRDYTLYVDGKPCGKANITIQPQEDGTTTVSCDTTVQVKVFLKTYRYTYQGREVWKGGRLQRLDSQCNDDGQRFQVAALADGDRLRVRVNNQDRLARGDAWLTSYWTVADVKARKDAVPLIDADTGRDLGNCTLQFIGAQQIVVAGQTENANHYKLTGKVQVDLWYDAADRLVRQEWIEDGHRTVLELNQVKKK
jgi:hypothetical protein